MGTASTTLFKMSKMASMLTIVLFISSLEFESNDAFLFGGGGGTCAPGTRRCYSTPFWQHEPCRECCTESDCPSNPMNQRSCRNFVCVGLVQNGQSCVRHRNCKSGNCCSIPLTAPQMCTATRC